MVDSREARLARRIRSWSFSKRRAGYLRSGVYLVKLELVLGRYDWPSAIENNGAVGEGRYKGRQASRCLSYSSRPGLKRPRPTTSFQNARGTSKPTERTMLLAYVNANFVRDKVTLSCIRATTSRGGQVGRRGKGVVTSPFRVTFEIVGHDPRLFLPPLDRSLRILDRRDALNRCQQSDSAMMMPSSSKRRSFVEASRC